MRNMRSTACEQRGEIIEGGINLKLGGWFGRREEGFYRTGIAKGDFLFVSGIGYSTPSEKVLNMS